MKFNIHYIIPQSTFFNEGKSGRVSHALGIINGFLKNKQNIKITASSSILNYIQESPNLKLNLIPHKCLELLFIFKCLRESNEEFEIIIVRKNIYVLLYYFIFLSFNNKKLSKICFEVNGISTSKRNIFYFISKLFHKIVLRKARLVYVVSEMIKTELSEGYFHVEKLKIIVLPNGSPSLNNVIQYNSNSKSIKFLFFGKFQPYNDFFLLNNAFNRLRKKYEQLVELHYVGFGPCKEDIINNTANNQGVYLWNQMSLDDLANSGIINKYTFGLIPLHYIEDNSILSPIKLYEYFTLGLPVIISDAVKEKNIINRNNIIIYNSSNLISLFNALEFVLINIDNYNQMSLESFNCSKRNSWELRMSSLLNKLNE
jgi:glycosyltransferase involved in cell wall biosynthesis